VKPAVLLWVGIFAVRLNDYDIILVNSSAGKDSQTTLDVICNQAEKQGVLDRVTVVHADLGRMEWQGTKELAKKQADHYGCRFEVTQYQDEDGNEKSLLDYIKERGKWPDSKNRFCTSEFKRGPIGRVFTKLAAELELKRPARILNAMGMRAEESPARAKKKEVEPNNRFTTGKKVVTNYHPLLNWTTGEVWKNIADSGVEHHCAYDKGMPRLSCCFCIFANKDALVTAGYENLELLQEYAATERDINHTFKHKQPISEILDLVRSGYVPNPVQSWTM
jgi:3'-phosphoadenosine 5'-phosphosulfate sulfotransferase (PAPS reductase)/FAD synthetase